MTDFAQTPATPKPAGLTDNAAGALVYVTIIPAIVFLIVEPYSHNRFVRFHAWQSIFLGIAAFAVDTVLSFIPIVGWILLPVAMLAFLALWILVLVKALKGQLFKLPLLGNLAEQQAGA